MVLCSLQGGSIITRLFGDLDYQFIPYITPGAPLSNFVQNNAKNASVLFLQNHGLVVRSDSLKKCLALTKYINEASRIFIGSRQQKETKTLLCSAEQHLFPDSVALQDESSIVNAYIFDNIIKAGLKPRLLTTQEIQAILSLESEKYRRKI
jgi:rhamnose utilization protein RhaD (predicted bifunctional aldolase and dehydrogenase)